MAGVEDASPHDKPAPNASTKQTPTPTPTPSPSKAAAAESLPIKKTGEIMLGFALSIIFLVIFCVIVHLLLKQHRQKYPNGRPKKKKKKKTKAKDLEKGMVELHSVDKKIYEAAGEQVVLCELPEDAPPRQELDAGDVFPLSPLERTYTGTTGVSATTSDWPLTPDIVVSPAEPEPRHLAVYWQTR
jgi:hypothetical protein